MCWIHQTREQGFENWRENKNINVLLKLHHLCWIFLEICKFTPFFIHSGFDDLVILADKKKQRVNLELKWGIR